MVQTQPKFKIDFKEEAVLAIQRQQRGDVLMILKDTTQPLIDRAEYRTLGEVQKEDWTADNYKLLTLAFMGNPSKVIVVKGEEDFADVQPKLGYYSNYTLCYPEGVEADFTAIKNYLKDQREKNNYSIAILGKPSTAPDVNYIVNFATDGIKANINGEETELTAGKYTARIAGALSGLASSRSLTYYELFELIDCTLSEDADEDVAAGKLVIIRQDGSFKLGRAVNSLTTLTDGVTEAFQKIRVSGIMDMIANDIIATFRTSYVGKYTNNFSNKNRFIGAINSYLNDLADEGLLESENDNAVYLSYDKIKSYLEGKGTDTSNMTYQEVLRANTGSKVLLDGVCSPTDAMEDLDITMYLFQALEQE